MIDAQLYMYIFIYILRHQSPQMIIMIPSPFTDTTD